jgi:hypothetical protein
LATARTSLRAVAYPDDGRYITADNLALVMQDLVPETAPHVAQLYQELDDGEELLTHGLLSRGFLWPVLMPAVEDGDRATLERCLLFVISLSRSTDSNVLDALFQRVTDPDSQYAHDIAKRLPNDLAAAWSHLLLHAPRG